MGATNLDGAGDERECEHARPRRSDEHLRTRRVQWILHPLREGWCWNAPDGVCSASIAPILAEGPSWYGGKRYASAGR